MATEAKYELRRMKDEPEPTLRRTFGDDGANGMSDIEGKAARVAASECGQRASFNYEAYCRRVRRWRPRASKK